MSTRPNGISTEQECQNKLGSSISVTNTKCVTYSRVVAMGGQVSGHPSNHNYNTSTSLIRYEDIQSGSKTVKITATGRNCNSQIIVYDSNGTQINTQTLSFPSDTISTQVFNTVSVPSGGKIRFIPSKNESQVDLSIQMLDFTNQSMTNSPTGINWNVDTYHEIAYSGLSTEHTWNLEYTRFSRDDINTYYEVSDSARSSDSLNPMEEGEIICGPYELHEIHSTNPKEVRIAMLNKISENNPINWNKVEVSVEYINTNTGATMMYQTGTSTNTSLSRGTMIQIFGINNLPFNVIRRPLNGDCPIDDITSNDYFRPSKEIDFTYSAEFLFSTEQTMMDLSSVTFRKKDSNGNFVDICRIDINSISGMYSSAFNNYGLLWNRETPYFELLIDGDSDKFGYSLYNFNNDLPLNVRNQNGASGPFGSLIMSSTDLINISNAGGPGGVNGLDSNPQSTQQKESWYSSSIDTMQASPFNFPLYMSRSTERANWVADSFFTMHPTAVIPGDYLDTKIAGVPMRNIFVNGRFPYETSRLPETRLVNPVAMGSCWIEYTIEIPGDVNTAVLGGGRISLFFHNLEVEPVSIYKKDVNNIGWANAMRENELQERMFIPQNAIKEGGGANSPIEYNNISRDGHIIDSDNYPNARLFMQWTDLGLIPWVIVNPSTINGKTYVRLAVNVGPMIFTPENILGYFNEYGDYSEYSESLKEFLGIREEHPGERLPFITEEIDRFLSDTGLYSPDEVGIYEAVKFSDKIAMHIEFAFSNVHYEFDVPDIRKLLNLPPIYAV